MNTIIVIVLRSNELRVDNYVVSCPASLQSWYPEADPGNINRGEGVLNSAEFNIKKSKICPKIGGGSGAHVPHAP